MNDIVEMGVTMNGIKISLLKYAVDLVLISRSRDELQKGLDALKSFCSERGSTDRRTVTDMNGKTRTLRCAPFLCRLRRRECCMLRAPSSQPANGPPTRTTSG